MVVQIESRTDEAIAGARGEQPPDGDGSNAKLHFGRGRRLPMIRQSEVAECGLACLAMIAGYHGHHTSLASLRQRFSLSLKGMTLVQLMDVAQTLGLSGRPVRLELNEVGRLAKPCVLHWDLNHFVVLRSVRGGRLVVHDPAAGVRTLSLEQMGKHFTGVAIELGKGPTLQRKRQEPPIALRALAGSIEGLGRALVTVFGLALALEVFALLTPQFMQFVVDQVLADGDHDLLALLGCSFLLLLILQVAFSALRTWTVVWLNTNLSLSWTGNVFQHLMHLPQSYFLKRHLGDVVSRFGGMDAIQRTLTTQFVTTILDGVMATLTFIVMLIYSPILTVLTAVAVLLYLASRLLYFRVYRESNLSQILMTARQQTRLMESIRGVQTIRLYGQRAAQTSRYLNATTDTLNTSIAIQRLNLLFGSLNSLTAGAQRIAVLWIGAWLALRGKLSAGMLVAYVAYADQFSSRAISLIDYFIQFRLIHLQGERLADIVMTPPEAHSEGTYAGPMPAPSIRFENVSFRYGDGEPWILKNCSFEIAEGESVAITGPTGSGKSTLVRLMLGLLDPQHGTIRIGGIDLNHLGKDRYRKMVGSVMQDDALLSGSIADNISFFDEHATPEKIEQAARKASLHEDVTRMPMGYLSLVGDMGSSLSGGQQQRVCLARALYGNPRLLILDEASSHLDAATEAHINRELDAMNLTRVAIAHRHETVAAAKRVLVFFNGQILPAADTQTRGRDAETEEGVPVASRVV